MATSSEWSQGYARQADADFKMFQSLQPNNSVKICHKLQFLQMACEKLVKGHLCGTGMDPNDLQSSHRGIAGTLPVVLGVTALALNYKKTHIRSVLKHARHLAKEIEVLAPAVKRGGKRPDNCEYPWEDENGALHVPLDWTFAPIQLLTAPAGRTFLKLVRVAISELVA